MLDREVFANSAVAEVINAKTVPFKLNAGKGEGRNLGKKFMVRGYPTTVIVDPKTKEEIDRITGYSPAALYLLYLEDILSGKNFAAIRKKALANPNDLDAWFGYAEELMERNPPEARKAWKKVASLDPRDEKGKGALALFEIARMKASEDRDPAPVMEIAEKFSGKPVALKAHGHLVQLLRRSTEGKDKKQVIASYQYLLSHEERDAETLNNYAWFLVSNNRSLNEALRMAQEAVELDPENAHILGTLAECFSKLGQRDQAVAAARKALEEAGPKERPRYEKRLKELESKELPEKRKL